MRRHMKTHLLLFLLFLGFSGYGQLTIQPEVVVLNGDPALDETKVDFVITNDGTEAVEIWWNLQPLDGPERWDYKVCDCNICYLAGYFTAPASMPCNIEPGANFTFSVYVLPSGELGEGSINFQILDNHGDTSALLDIPIEVTVEGTSSTENTSLTSDLSLYPNPAYDGFNITDDADVTQVVIFNILGKQIKSDSHYAGRTHDISSLERGYYLVRIVDKYQNDKVLRLTKK